MSRDEFRKNLELGLRIEERVLLLLGKEISGLQLTPITTGGDARRGPRVYSKDFENFELVAHDMRGDFANQTFDVQIKGKGYSPYYKNWRSYMHGIDLPIHNQYKTGGELTGRKLLMIFFEIFQGKDGPGYIPSAVAQFWHNLSSAQVSGPSPSFPNGGAFWPRGAFVPIINTGIRPPQLIVRQSDRAPNAHLLLRREFLKDEDEPQHFCRRCGRVEMFRPRHAQTMIWQCMHCDAPSRHSDIEQRTFAVLPPDERLFALFGNKSLIYGSES